MPYIKPHERAALDPIIDALALSIGEQASKHTEEGAFAGLLNYACTRLALKILRGRFGKIRYWLVALVSGTFRNIGDEFYRRLATPYEEKQKEKFGDVDLFKEFSDEINKP